MDLLLGDDSTQGHLGGSELDDEWFHGLEEDLAKSPEPNPHVEGEIQEETQTEEAQVQRQCEEVQVQALS